MAEKKTAYERVSEERKKLVEELIEKMKEGKVPSKALWNSLAIRPQNPTSNIYYQGGNRLKLGYVAAENGYKDPRWMTFKQASELGYKIKKGEHGTLCEKWIFTEKIKEKDKNGNEVETEELRNRPVVNYFVVFNAEQIEGVPPLEIAEKSKSEMLNIAQDFVNSSECNVKEIASERAYYSPSNDEIIVPIKEVFKSDEAYLKTLLHEMGHSTGHSSRLNRDQTGEFGSEKYAREELTAELTSVFISGNLGIQLEGEHFNDHSNYLSSWIKALENNPNELFSAAVAAEKAADRLQNNYENYLETEKTKDNLQEWAKENLEHIQIKEPILTMDLSEKLGYPSKGEIFEKEDERYELKIHELDKDTGKTKFSQEISIPEGGGFYDIKFTKEALEEYKNNLKAKTTTEKEKVNENKTSLSQENLDSQKDKLLYRNVLELPEGKSIQVIIHENKNKAESDYIVDTSRHDPQKEGLEKNSYKLNEGEKIPGEENITVNKDLIKSELFKDLSVKFHWSEDKLGVENGSSLGGIEAYNFIKDLKERDDIKSVTRETDLNSSYYDKTKLEIKYYDSSTGGTLYDTGPIRIDLGDRELANSNTVSEAVRDRLLLFPKELEKIATEDLSRYNKLREKSGMEQVTKEDLLNDAENKKTAIEKVFQDMSKNEKILNHVEKTISRDNLIESNSKERGESSNSKTTENKEVSTKPGKVKIKATNYNYGKTKVKDNGNEL